MRGDSTTARIPLEHPGVILSEEFMIPLGIKPAHLAEAIGVGRARVGEIIKGDRKITAETADLLAQFFGNSARFWMNLQSHYDLELARDKKHPRRVKKRIAMIGDEPWLYDLDENGKVTSRKKIRRAPSLIERITCNTKESGRAESRKEKEIA